MSIITLGLDPVDSKVVTLGYGPEVEITVTVLGFGGGRGTTGRKRQKWIISIRDPDSNKVYEQVLTEDELRTIKIQITENEVLDTEKVIIVVKERLKNSPSASVKIRLSDLHETRKEQKANTGIRHSNRGRKLKE